jgi:hypothetical protein
MDRTDSSSIRENDEPDKKQKSRRPPSTSASRIMRIAQDNGRMADYGGQIPRFANSA